MLLRELMQADDAPSVSTFIEREASAAQVLEFLVHRSAYQLKEADPHTWALPRLHGKPKAAMVEVQADEYGNGRAETSTPSCSRARWTPSAWTPPTAPTSSRSRA